MKYIARSNRIYALLLTLSRRQQLVVTAGIMSIIVISWFLLLYQPLKSRMRSCQKKIADHAASTHQCADLHAHSETLEQKIKSDEEQIKQYGEKNGARDYLSTIAKLGNQSLVCIEHCSLETMEEKEALHLLPITIKGHGTIAQLTEFFSKISASFSTAAPSQITLDHIKDNVYQCNVRLTLLNLE